jgi:hypothetical protein
MAYVPNNPAMYVAAYAGALAGMGASDRFPTDPVPAHYNTLASIAGAYAETFDTLWALSPTSTLDIEACQELSEVAWQDRAPQSIPPVFILIELCLALIAMIRAAEAYFASQGIVPPLPPSGGGANFKTNTTVAAPAQVLFPLSNPPIDPPNIILSVNGVIYQQGSDYTVAAGIVTWLNTLFTLNGDTVRAYYQVA